MSNISIKITGSGTAEEVAKALKSLAFDLEAGDYIFGLKEKGKCEWEDSILMTVIKEEEVEDEE